MTVTDFIKASSVLENTLLSFHEAAAIGAKFVEFDVQVIRTCN